ncbi:hypothetical protein GQR58_003171 [Nymphon striatum]|nr:hypothetical protein GQR58_003171 [Nymphon striatum]
MDICRLSNPNTFVSQLGSEGKHTEVIVDIGISDSESMQAAIQRADRILIPIAPSQADVWSTQRFLKQIKDIRKSGSQPEILGFMNRSDTHRAVRETDDAFDALQGLPGITMLEPRLYQRTAYRRSFSEGLAVFEMDPKSKAAHEVETLGQEYLMYIVRWLKGHPLIAVWVLGIIAILLSQFGGTSHKEEIVGDHKIEAVSSENISDSKHADGSGKSVAEAFEGKPVETINSQEADINAEGLVSTKQEAPKDSVVEPLKVDAVTASDDAASPAQELKQAESIDKPKEKIQVNESLANVESTEEAVISSLPAEEVKGAVEDIKASNKEDMLLMAREAFWNNGLDEAAEIYIQLIKLEPDVLDHKGELGNVYWRQGYPKKAAELYSEIAIPMIQDGKTEPVANMLGFIGLFYPDRAAQINDHLQATANKKK